MQLVKYNSWQVLKSYMFLHWGAIFREFFFLKKGVQAQHATLGTALLLLEWLEY